MRAANDLGGCTIVPDAGRSAEENVEVLLRTLRLVQLGLEVQVADNDGLLQETNTLRDEIKVRGRCGRVSHGRLHACMHLRKEDRCSSLPTHHASTGWAYTDSRGGESISGS